MIRVLVTGSRGWANRKEIDKVLEEFIGDEDCVLVHGDCPTGADAMADEWASSRANVAVERHPAHWKEFGRAAGPLRNDYMVALGADLCLAFISQCTSPRCDIQEAHSSHGALGCATLAQESGIRTIMFKEEF